MGYQARPPRFSKNHGLVDVAWTCLRPSLVDLDIAPLSPWFDFFTTSERGNEESKNSAVYADFDDFREFRIFPEKEDEIR
jgi:hypothetical protein